MKITPEQAREALDAWICRPGMTQEQATILITEAFWALKERPNIDVQRVTDEGGAVDQRALGVNRVKIFERWKAIDTRDKREKFTALVPAIMEASRAVNPYRYFIILECWWNRNQKACVICHPESFLPFASRWRKTKHCCRFLVTNG